MPADPLHGRNLGKYQVLEPLGRGGMARVYRAYHPQLDRYVAIKVLRSDLVEEEEFLGRFRREAQAVAALRHPHIIQVFDFDAQDDIYYMVMELLEGDSLRTRLNDYRVLKEWMPLGEVVRVLLDVLDGLEYAHSEGMVHRDVKPGNILLSRLGRAVLTDFGIAQIVGGTRYTVSGALMGTLNYMAPEQAMEGQCDARSDVYSLGIVFYEMLMGDPPFDADTPLAILMKHLNDSLPQPRKTDPTIPKALERVVVKALAKRPQRRYQSAAEMGSALRTAAKRARIVVPARISLPLSFTTAEAPSESVAVISGTARAQIGDAEFSGEDTDAALGRRLAALAQQGAETPNLDSARAQAVEKASLEMAAVPELAQSVGPEPVKNTSSEPGKDADLDLARSAILKPAERTGPDPAAVRRPPGRHNGRRLPGEHRSVGEAILKAMGIVAVGNLIVVFLGILTRWWGVYVRGWPFELLLLGWGLCLIMEATGSVWLLIPTAIVLGNGLLMAFYALTGAWRTWAFLWPLEPLLIVGTVWYTMRLAQQGEQGREVSRHLARRLQRPAMVASIIVVLVGAIVG